MADKDLPFYMLDEFSDHILNEEEEEEKVDVKKVDISALEFSWIFKGYYAKSFIEQLIGIDNEQIL